MKIRILSLVFLFMFLGEVCTADPILTVDGLGVGRNIPIPGMASIEHAFEKLKIEVYFEVLAEVLREGGIPVVLPILHDKKYLIYPRQMVRDSYNLIYSSNNIVEPNEYYDCDNKANYNKAIIELVFQGAPVFKFTGCPLNGDLCHSWIGVLTDEGILPLGGTIKSYPFIYEINGG